MNNILFKICFATAVFLPVNKSHRPSDYLMEEPSSEVGREEGLTIQDSSNSSIMIGIADKASEEESDLEDGIPILEARKTIMEYSDEILRSGGKNKTTRKIKYPQKKMLRDAEPKIITAVTEQTAQRPIPGYTLYPRKLRATSTTLSGMQAWPKDRLDAHYRRIREVGNHMSMHYLSTLYLYEEVQRIKRERVILDELRHMAADLEHPNHDRIKSRVMQCYTVYKPKEIKDIWIYKTNNLIMNFLRDPVNEGVI